MGFENDLLGREKYANFLSELINNPEKYKRDSDSESMCIAIDSGWGTGKTTFINMWKEKMEENNNDSIIIKYDAWKNDFSNNPFETLVYELISNPAFDELNDKVKRKKYREILTEFVAKIGAILVKFGVMVETSNPDFAQASGDAFENIVKTTHESINEAVDNAKKENLLFENYYYKCSEYKRLIAGFKDCLEKIAVENKIIIIIDELDRCKPIFAIKLLESIKHIFDAKGVSFVFALDLEQLGYSVKSVYGQDVDANGYLCRFFDYISKMPTPDKRNYIKVLMKKRPLNRCRLNRYIKGKGWIEEKFEDIFYNYSIDFNLSLRDIESIYANFCLFENLNLKKTTAMEAYELYLFLIILKYKRIDIFNEILLDKNNTKLKQSIFNKYENKVIDFFPTEVVKFLVNSKKIKDTMFIINCDGNIYKGKIIECANSLLRYLDSSKIQQCCEVDSDSLASNILFLDDFENYTEIKEKELTVYIQEKLEFFDFKNQVVENDEIT